MFHELSIAAAIRDTEDSVVLTFDVPDETHRRFAFEPGQHLTLRAMVGGRDTRRTYSIVSGPGEPLSVGIRIQERGAFSTFAGGLQAGQSLLVMPPTGRFVYSGQRSLLLCAAGSGITPVLSIASHALAGGAEAVLLYGNRTAGSSMFLDRLIALKDRHLETFRIFHTLSREGRDHTLQSGRLDRAKIERLAGAGSMIPDDCDGIFICGPDSMIDDVSGALAGAGFPPSMIHSERFATGRQVTRSAAPEPEPMAEGAEIEVMIDGARKRFRLGPDDRSVIAAALRNGIDLPYSCRGGMCCTCRCRVISGKSSMAVNYSLQPWEIEAGFTLACQTRPCGNRLVLDFDAT